MAGHTDQKTERWERAAKIAADVLEECRVQLMLKFRFLDLALWRMPAQAVHVEGRYPLSTDAKTVYYEPFGELNRFEEGFDELVRDYLHLVMHCIFRHPFDEGHKNHQAWWLACDIMAESVCMEMCGGRFVSELDADRRTELSNLKLLTGALMPAKLYQLFDGVYKAPHGKSHQGLNLGKLAELQALFERDAHEAWPAFAKQEQEEKPGDVEELAEQDDSAPEEAQASQQREQQLEQAGETVDAQGERQSEHELEGGESDEAPETGDEEGDDVSQGQAGTPSAQPSEQGEGTPDDEADDQLPEQGEDQEKEWEDIAKQIEMNLETFSREWGDEAASLIASLEIANRKVYNYTDFLRRFSTIAEDMKINDDEYDYIFYTYGLDLYGNMPLVEPLEYMETKRVRDFVIAIDTSGSVKGPLVKRFVQHTFEILRESEGFHGGKVNIHIIQCDAKVQADTKISSMKELDAYMERFYVRGFGGTDFRPVFDYVDDLRTQGELADLQGLIYFTDGLGYFPTKPPDYDAAFVFMEQGEAKLPPVPPWAMKVVIDEEGINKLKSSERFM